MTDLTEMRETGFHRLDADFTRGRGIAISKANAEARAAIWRTRQVALIAKEKSHD